MVGDIPPLLKGVPESAKAGDLKSLLIRMSAPFYKGRIIPPRIRVRYSL